MSVTFETFADLEDNIMSAAFRTDLVNLDVVIYDDSEAMEAYVTEQTTANADYTEVVYSDGYTMATQLRVVDVNGEIDLLGVCIDGTSPETETDAADGSSFTTCTLYASGNKYSYAKDSLADTSTEAPGDYTTVIEANDIGYNMSWVCAYEDTTTSDETDAGNESASWTCARFLPSLGDDGEYDAADLRFDSATVDGRICYFENPTSSQYVFECIAPQDADGEATWAGAATVYAGAVVAIAATLF